MPTRLLAALAVGVLVLSGCGRGEALPGGDDPARSDGCPQVELVGLRGQAQSLHHHRALGTEVDGITRRIADGLARDGVRDVRIEAIRHRSRVTSTLSVFQQDVAQGKRLLARKLTSLERRCPSTRIGVVGFSQGAQIAHETLAAHPRLARHVDTLVLVGSPRRDPDARVTRVDLPGPQPSAPGSLGAGPSLGGLTGRTIEACITGDVVCAFTGTRDYTIHKHAYERPSVADAIARAALPRLTPS